MTTHSETIAVVPELAGLVGQSILRVEDRALLTGAATFLDDVKLPGEVLHVAYVRSTLAHGIIKKICSERAETINGVLGVFTHQDLADVPDLVTPVANACMPPRPILPCERVRYVGEPIAAVVAVSRYIAEDAAAQVEVEIEPLPSVSDIADALDPEKPVLHLSAEITSNVIFERKIDVGDVDEAFQNASHIIERGFTHPRVSPSPMEGRGAAAYVEEDGQVVLWVSTQTPQTVKEVISDLFGLRVRVLCPDIGGGFGLKAVSIPEELLVAWLASELGRAVKWVEDRSEGLLASGHARDFEVKARAAADSDGNLLAIELDVMGNAGAYSLYPVTHTLETGGVLAMTPGPYRLSNYRARGRALATNTCPAGPYRGVGLPVSTLVHERLMDILAKEVGISPVEIRRRNLITSDELPYTTVTDQAYDFGDYPAALETAVKLLGYDEFVMEQASARKNGRILGIGLATYVEWTGTTPKLFQQRGMTAMKGYDSCQLRLGRDGVLQAWTSCPSIGQGTATAYAQILADASGVDFRDIQVLQSDTGSGGADGLGTGNARSAGVTAGAIVKAGRELKARILEDAEATLHVSQEELDLRAGLVTALDGSGKFISLPDLAAASPDGRYAVNATYAADRVMYSYGTHGCKVEVDPATGQVRILDYIVAEDCGRVINPMLADGQTRGGVAQGMAAALYESFDYDSDGQPLGASFMDYLIPTASEMFRTKVHHLSMHVPHSIIGAKGAGEGGTIGAGACVANAVSNALETECNRLPMHPEALYLQAQSLLKQPS